MGGWGVVKILEHRLGKPTPTCPGNQGCVQHARGLLPRLGTSRAREVNGLVACPARPVDSRTQSWQTASVDTIVRRTRDRVAQ